MIVTPLSLLGLISAGLVLMVAFAFALSPFFVTMTRAIVLFS
jgi:hypothetical protein